MTVAFATRHNKNKSIYGAKLIYFATMATGLVLSCVVYM